MTGDDEDDQSLGGGFDGVLMGAVVDQHVAATPTMDSLEPAAMLRPLARYVAKRFQGMADQQEAYSVFLHSAYPDNDQALFPDADEHHHLARSRAHDPFGRVHLVGTGLDRALSIAVACNDPEPLHAWLGRHGLLSRPMAWVDAALRVVIWYPNGFEDEATSREFEVPVPAQIDHTAVDQALAIFHAKCTLVPKSKPKFWHSAAKNVPCEHTEKRIQDAMQISLDTRFHYAFVQREVPLSGSEIDFVISEPVDGVQTPVCALEIKVIREKHFAELPTNALPCPPSANRAAVISGIKQAAVARDELGTALAYMTAFDMRASDSDDLIVSSNRTAERLHVECRRYFMYNSKSSYRDAATASRLGSQTQRRTRGTTPDPRRPD